MKIAISGKGGVGKTTLCALPRSGSDQGGAGVAALSGEAQDLRRTSFLVGGHTILLSLLETCRRRGEDFRTLVEGVLRQAIASTG